MDNKMLKSPNLSAMAPNLIEAEKGREVEESLNALVCVCLWKEWEIFCQGTWEMDICRAMKLLLVVHNQGEGGGEEELVEHGIWAAKNQTSQLDWG